MVDMWERCPKCMSDHIAKKPFTIDQPEGVEYRDGVPYQKVTRLVLMVPYCVSCGYEEDYFKGEKEIAKQESKA